MKCDEAKPTCVRCQKADIPCEGYGVRLSWTSSKNPLNFRRGTTAGRIDGSRNENERATRQSRKGHSDAEVSHVEPLDDGGTEEDSRHHLAQVGDTVPTDHDEQSNTDQNLAPISPFQRRSQDKHHRDQTPTSTTPVSYPTQYVPIAAFSPRSSLSFEGNGYSDITWLPLQQQPSAVPVTHRVPNGSTGQDQSDQPQPVPRHLDRLSNPSLQCQLMEHWALHLCDALNPMPGIHNPLRTTFLPLAREGARADMNTSTGATALFHLICSASAFHLSKTSDTAESGRVYENEALEHHNLGIAHLGKNIQSDDETQYVAILASLLMCLLNEAITVPSPFWRLHIQGAVSWVNHVSPQVWHQTESASVIYQMFTAMAIIIQSQLLPDDRNRLVWDVHYDPALQPKPYALEEVFGIPQAILQTIYAMNVIQIKRQRLDTVNTLQDIEQRAMELDRLELDIFLAAPKKQTSVVGREHGELMYHHGYAYYFAALIYMRRTLKDLPIEDVQPLVEKSLLHIEALASITDQPFSPLMWPIAMIAFEVQQCVTQNRMLKCLDFFASRSGLAVWTEFATLVRKLWDSRINGGTGNISWYRCLPFSSNECMLI